MNQVKQLIKETKKYLTKYDYEKVIECCDKILEIKPQSSFGLRFNAIANSQTGNYTRALEYYNRLYELYPDEETKYELAYAYEKTGNLEQALEYYCKIGAGNRIKVKLLTKLKRFQTIIDEYDDKIKE